MTMTDAAAAGPPRAPFSNGAIDLTPPPLPVVNGAGDGTVPPLDPPPVAPGGPRRRMQKHSEAKREAVRRDVETTARPLKDISKEHGVGCSTISAWIRKFNWSRPDDAPPLRIAGGSNDRAGQRIRLIARLHKTFGLQLAALEKRAKEASGESIEKDARTLGVLAKTLETITQLDRDDGAKVKEPEPRDRDLEQIDADLAARIAAWADEGEEA